MPPPASPREKSRLGGIYFVLAAVVVALGVVLWLVMDDGPSVTDAPAPMTPAPATTAPATPAEPAPSTATPDTAPPATTSN